MSASIPVVTLAIFLLIFYFNSQLRHVCNVLKLAYKLLPKTTIMAPC